MLAGSLSQAPWKQLPACFIYSTPVQPVSLGYTLKANSGMTPIQYTLGLHWTGLWDTGNTVQRLQESYKAGIISWWNLLDPLGVPTLTPWDHLFCVTLCQNTVAIGADTVLRLRGTNSGAKRRKFFFSVLSPICVVPPNPGAQRGHTTVENRHCENNMSLKKQGTVDLATGP